MSQRLLSSETTNSQDTPASMPDRRRAILDAIPIMLGFVPFALVLGTQAATKGLSTTEVPLMTGLNFAGGSEFTAVNLWSSPPHLLLIVAMSMLVNSRHLLMGAVMSRYMHHVPKRKALPLLFFMCDESWAMAISDAQKHGRLTISVRYYLTISLMLYATWVVFTGLGAVLGPLLGDLNKYGFDVAFTAVFLVLLRGMWQSAQINKPWLISLVAAAISAVIFPGAWYVAAGTVAGLWSAWYWSRK